MEISQFLLAVAIERASRTAQRLADAGETVTELVAYAKRLEIGKRALAITQAAERGH